MNVVESAEEAIMKQEPTFPMGFDHSGDAIVYNEGGVDLSSIHWCLSLSMEVRLQPLQDRTNSLLMMQHEVTIT